MPKHKPIEGIIITLRSLAKEHPEQSLGSHIIMATGETDLELLSDKVFLEYLEAYNSNINNPFLSDEEEWYEDDEYAS